MRASFVLIAASSFFTGALAATADEWRGRSIYQIITDRYALPAGADTTKCDPGAQTWCGGTWQTITNNLDYIQNAGFTAIWISPVNQNWQGGRTPYGDPYHGYWIQDHSQLNEHFGTADDLQALSAEVHRRGMLLMVDVVANNVMAESTTPDYSKYMFKDPSQYHPYCPVAYGNRTSEMNCWLGDTNVTLPDLNTQDPTVASTYQSWIQDLVHTYSIDGLRIDAAKHVDSTFWAPFCAAAGVFCMGEVFGDDVSEAAGYTGPNGMDSVLNYPMYDALVEAFSIPGPANVTAIAAVMNQSSLYHDTTVLGNFLENQDNPRWLNISVDPQSLYNAMAFTFMSDGIPIVYYGQEQGFHGNSDPYNREPLWTSGYNNRTTTYGLIQTLNQLRNHMVSTSEWATQPTQLLATSPQGIAIAKGSVVSILTTVGSPPQAGASMGTYTPFAVSTATTDIISCTQYSIGSGGTVSISYEKGGRPVILVPTKSLSNSGICSAQLNTDQGGLGVNPVSSVKNKNSAAAGVVPAALSLFGAALAAAVLA